MLFTLLRVEEVTYVVLNDTDFTHPNQPNLPVLILSCDSVYHHRF